MGTHHSRVSDWSFAGAPRRMSAGMVVIGVVILSFCTAREAIGAETNHRARYLRMAAEPGITLFQKKAYEQLASLPSEQFWGNISIPGLSITLGGVRLDDSYSKHPIDVLYRMGLDVLPIIVEALDDNTPTETVSQHLNLGFGKMKITKVWNVNELVALVIGQITDRDFIIGEGRGRDSAALSQIGRVPERAPEFKKALLEWYQKNGKKSLAERKIIDAREGSEAAIQWLGEHKEKAGQQAIMDRIDSIFAGDMSHTITVGSELSLCALALGQIGERSALGHVRRVCKYHSSRPPKFIWIDMSNLFRSFHGLALLGEKEEAVRELNGIYRAYYFETPNQKDFKEQLDAAEEW